MREAVKRYLELVVNEQPKIIGRALWSYAVIEYGKCYHRNEGWTVTLESSATLKNIPEEFKEGHKWFIVQRDTFLAHGGKSSSHLSKVFYAQRDEFPNQIDGLLVNTMVARAPSKKAMEVLDRLAEIGYEYARNQGMAIEGKIFQMLLENGNILHPEIHGKFKMSKPKSE